MACRDWGGRPRLFAAGVAGTLLICYAYVHSLRAGPAWAASGAAREADAAGEVSFSAAERRGWMEQHDKYVDELRRARQAGGLDVLFYGDSITESWRASDLGSPCQRCAGVPEVWHRHFGSAYRALALGIGGDATPHLLWRLQHGESPEGLHARAVVVLIGTNDLTNPQLHENNHTAEAGRAVAHSVGVVVRFLLAAAPEAHIVLQALLPRGERHNPDPVARQRWPSKYAPAIEAANAELRKFAAGHAERVTSIDCGGLFLESDPAAPGHQRVRLDLMPDVLHPSPEGYEQMAQCLESVLHSHAEPNSQPQ